MDEAAKAKKTPTLESTGLSKIKTWNLNVKKRFQINSGECLVDPTYKYKTNLTLDKDEYNAALSKHYMLGQLLRFFGWLGALDIASKVK